MADMRDRPFTPYPGQFTGAKLKEKVFFAAGEPNFFNGTDNRFPFDKIDLAERCAVEANKIIAKMFHVEH